MKENSIKNERSSIRDRIEEKYTRYLNCETDTLELSIEEAIFILESDAGMHYVEDLLQEAYKVILSDYKRVLKENEELNKKIKEQKECAFREDGTEECLWYCSNCHDEWLFYEGTPEENNLKYCPHCGAKVIKYESYIETEIEIANKMAKDYLKESEK